MKLVPFTVSVKAAPPVVALVGDIEVIVGTGLFIGNVSAPDVPPPGLGLVTVIFAVPEFVISVAGTWAVSCVALAKLVVSAVPFQFTTAPLTKLLPFTVSVNAAPPTNALAGESEETIGAVLLIAKVTGADVPPPGAGLVTVMLADPALAISLAGTWAVSWLALAKVVVSAVPFHFTTEFATKLAPLTVNVKVAPPTVAPVGATDATVGAGLLMGNVAGADVPPPGAGLMTVMLAEPELATSLAGTWAVI
jgi:hypothetical protein